MASAVISRTTAPGSTVGKSRWTTLGALILPKRLVELWPGECLGQLLEKLARVELLIRRGQEEGGLLRRGGPGVQVRFDRI